MRAAEIQLNGTYRAIIGGKATTVRVDAIREVERYVGNGKRRHQTIYDVTNLTTGRTTTFKSAQKFIKPEVNLGKSAREVRETVPTSAGASGVKTGASATPPSTSVECDDSPGGKHEFTPDLEYDPTGKTINCKYCGEADHRPDPTSQGTTKTTDSTTATDEDEHRDPFNWARAAIEAGYSSDNPPPLGWNPNGGMRPPSAMDTSASAARNGSTPMKTTTPTSSPAAAAARPAEQPATPGGIRLADRQPRPLSHDDAPHLVVVARAGTGKTTTIIEGMKRWKGQPTRITPSPQQQRVWDEIMRSPPTVSCAFVAFNRSIAQELKERVPPGVEAMTMHSMGMRVVNRSFQRLRVDQYRVQNLISRETGKDTRELRREDPVFVKAVEELVGLCKMNLVGFNRDGEMIDESHSEWAMELEELAERHGIDLNGSRQRVFETVPKILRRCADPKADGSMDFDDMVWLPVVLNLPVSKFGVLFGDEVQDWNRCQQELAKRAGHRLILVGDDKQSIYGFAGADSDSIPRLRRELGEEVTGENGRPFGSAEAVVASRGCTVVPLTVTRRCGKAIVAEAKRYVPDFEAHEDNPPGKVDYAVYPTDKDGKVRPEPHYTAQVKDGDFIICRTNAPLVRECFRFIKKGRRANIQGRDVAAGLISTVKKQWGKDWERVGQSATIPDLIHRLTDWHEAEVAKEQAKRNPSENKIQGLDDRLECLLCFCSDGFAQSVETGVRAGAMTAADVVARIEGVFTDDKSIIGIRLSSIHRVKGLESKRVFVLKPPGKGMPTHKMKGRELEQEDNLAYVACTRAIEELIYVS